VSRGKKKGRSAPPSRSRRQPAKQQLPTRGRPPARQLRSRRLTPGDVLAGLKRIGASGAARVAAALLVLLVIGGGAIWEAHRLERDSPTHLSASLSQIGGISAVFGSQPDGGVSPACGCAYPPKGDWRGVTFAGRTIALSRSGNSAWTEWVLSGPSEGPVSFYDSYKRLDAKVIRFRLHDWQRGGTFDPDWLLNKAELERRVTVLTDRAIHSHVLKLINHGSLHVAMTGPIPIGAWVPLKGAKVTLGSSPGPFPDEPVTLELADTYPPVLGQQNYDALLNREGYSLGDFIGPNVVFWSDDPSTESPGTPLAHPGGDSVTAVVIGGSTFSARLGIVPLSGAERELSHLYYQSVPPFRARESVHWGAADGGTVHVRITNPLSPLEYAALRRRVARHSKVTVTGWEDRWYGPLTATPTDTTLPRQSVRGEYYESMEYPGTIHDSGTGPHGEPLGLDSEPPKDSTANHGWVPTEEFYPPLPQEDGFNVFGPLSHLHISDAVGSLLVGDRTVALGSPAEVAFRGLTDLRDAQHEQLLPVPITTSLSHARIQLTAVAGVSVNDSTETSYAQQHNATLSDWLFVIGLISCVCAVVGLAWRVAHRGG